MHRLKFVSFVAVSVATLILSQSTTARGESPSLAEGTIDHLFDYNALTHRTDVNGMGQTFVAPGNYLTDASFLLTAPDGTRQWWADAHFELRRGLPGSLVGNDHNVLYRSPTIDFATMPVVGTGFSGGPLYELSLKNLGAIPLPLVPGELYTIAVIDRGTSGGFFYASNQPSTYPDGGVALHFKSYADTSWLAPIEYEDMAFRVVTSPVPEPAGTWLLAPVIVLWLRRRAFA